MEQPTDDSADTKGSEIDRRSYLTSAAAAAGAVAAGSAVSDTTEAASNVVDLGEEGLQDGDTIDPYLDTHFVSGNEVRIPEGSYEWNGDDLGRVSDASLIGDGQVELHRPQEEVKTRVWADGGTVLLKNIAIKGKVTGDSQIRPTVEDADAEMIFENVRLPDGAVDPSEAVGVYVPALHAGTLRFRNCHIEGFSDNGLYGSAPGGHPDYDEGNGPVIVEGGLYKNNNISNVRLGSDDSVARNVTIVNDAKSPENSNGGHAQRGIRIRQAGENIRIENCDIIQTYTGTSIPMRINDGASGGSGVVKNTRIRNETSAPAIGTASGYEGDWRGENVHITGGGSMEYRIPIDPVCVGDKCERPGEAGDARLLSFVSTQDAGEATYDFAADGRIDATTASEESPSGNPIRSISNYEINQTSEGFRAEGSTGNGYGDAYLVYGDVTDVTVDHPDWMWIELDGQEVTAAELTGEGDETDDTNDGGSGGASDELPNTLTIDGTGGRRSTYTFTVTGDVEVDESTTTAGDSAWDQLQTNITDGRVLGIVGDGVDGFRYSGELQRITVCGDAWVSQG